MFHCCVITRALHSNSRHRHLADNKCYNQSFTATSFAHRFRADDQSPFKLCLLLPRDAIRAERGIAMASYVPGNVPGVATPRPMTNLRNRRGQWARRTS